MDVEKHGQLTVCHCCGLAQSLPNIPPRHHARCARCGSRLPDTQRHGSNLPALAAAISAMILFVPAISLPMLRLEKLGFVQESSILSGTIALLQHGEVLVGLVVLICSVVFPIGKLLLIALLCLRPPRQAKQVALMHRLVEHLGRWGMVDILLVAVMVAALKLGDLVSVSPGQPRCSSPSW